MEPRPYHLLVVEDDENIASAISRLTRGSGSVQVVTTVADATEAIAGLAGPVVALVDLGLPDGSGFEVIEALRSRMPNAPVMVLTGNTEPDAVNRVHLMHAEFVSKPEFSANLRDFLARATVTVNAATKAARLPTPSGDHVFAERIATHEVVDPFALLAPLLSSITHELNNPLSYLTVNLAMLQERIADQGESEFYTELREMLDDAVSGAKVIGDLIHDFGTLSRAGRSGRVAHDVESLARAAVRLCHHVIRHRASLEESYEDVTPVGVEPSGLQRVLTYLTLAAASRIPLGALMDNKLKLSARPSELGVAVEIRAIHSGAAATDTSSSMNLSLVGSAMLVQLARAWVVESGGTLSITAKQRVAQGSETAGGETVIVLDLPRAETALS